MSNPQKVFRQSALDKLANPEELDGLIQVTRRRGWIALAGLMLLVLLAILWGIFGSIPTVMKAGGVLVRQNGLREINAPAAGQLSGLTIRPGDTVKENQLIARVLTAGGESQITSSFAGQVLEVPFENNQIVPAGAVLASLEMTSQPLQGIFFVPLAEGKNLRPGLRVQITPSTARPQESGYLLGTISYISPLPVSPETLYNQLKNRALVEALGAGGLNLQVEVTLTRDAGSFSGFKWTSGGGPRLNLTNGTLSLAEIQISEQRPISLVLPFFG